MLAMIQRLIERDYAYVDSAGQVYFDISKFPEYGKLSGKILDDLVDGARVQVRDEKRNPRDFALWKVDTKHLMQWNPHGAEGWRDDGFERLQHLVPGGVDKRIGVGFPGWHIECSAMSAACLGPVIDLHTGGEDNVFPHHECEIAQSYGARADEGAPKSFARTWVHGRHLMVNGKKMAKSAGTFLTARELFDPKGCDREALAKELSALGFDDGKVPPAVLRYALVSVPYTQPMNFTLAGLVQAKASVERLQSLYDRLRESAGALSSESENENEKPDAEFSAQVAKHESAFD
jgi:cysteinyl-tRNA synthetase